MSGPTTTPSWTNDEMLLAVSSLFVRVAEHQSAVSDAVKSAVQSENLTAIREVAIALELMTKSFAGFEPHTTRGES